MFSLPFCGILPIRREVFNINEQQLHEIAVAYAQVKLRAYQEEHKDAIDYNPLSCDSKEMYHFAKAYRFALDNFEHELDEVG